MWQAHDVHCMVADGQLLIQRQIIGNPHPATLVTQMLRSILASDAASEALTVTLPVHAEVPEHCYRTLLQTVTSYKT